MSWAPPDPGSRRYLNVCWRCASTVADELWCIRCGRHVEGTEPRPWQEDDPWYYDGLCDFCEVEMAYPKGKP